MVKFNDCPFCMSEEENVRKLRQVAPNLEHDRCVYLSTDNLMSTVDAHPVIPESPYFLTVPKEHYTSFAKMPSCFADELSQHISFLTNCVNRDLRHRDKKNVFIFEHGQSKHGNTVKSVYHAHLHLIFTSMDADLMLDKVLQEFKKLGVDYCLNHRDYVSNVLGEIHEYVPQDTDYLFFSVNNKQVIAIDNGQYELYSQFFRVILANAYGIKFINWKEANGGEMDMFAERLYSSLPKNIRY